MFYNAEFCWLQNRHSGTVPIAPPQPDYPTFAGKSQRTFFTRLALAKPLATKRPHYTTPQRACQQSGVNLSSHPRHRSRSHDVFIYFLNLHPKSP